MSGVTPATSTLAHFRNRYRGASVIVCGCGESLTTLTTPPGTITIGTNDVGRLFDPDYLVVVNPPAQFSGDRWRYIEQSRARYVFSQLDLPVRHAPLVRFRLGRFGGAGFDEPDILHYTQNSPYVAVSLALFMGASRIGLIGVDFTDHHFFGATGVHPLSHRLEQIDREYARACEVAASHGAELVNLSATSRLRSIPRGSLDAFLAATADRAADAGSNEAAAAPAGMQIVSYSVTPVAGVPAVLARCIQQRTPHRARCVWADNAYGNGVAFDGDVEWSRMPEAAEDALRSADLVIVHNGKIEQRHEQALAGKAVVTMAHNYGWNVDQRFVRQGFPGVVVGQYQAGLPEFADWRIVPNPVPLWEPAFQPAVKPREIAICYTPSGRHECYPREHKLYWHSKGYDTTMRVLDRLSPRFPVRLEVIRREQISHAESLAMKRRSHIVIDECVTGSYHRNSLEGLAAGCVVVNGVGLLPEIVRALETCAPDAASLPFVFSRLDNLEDILIALLERGPETLAEQGRSNRTWLERHWAFDSQWNRFWRPPIEQAIERVAPHRVPAVTVPAQMSKAGVSVVVPHGGADRLPQLAAALVNLRQCRGVGEIIVAEMGETAVAEALARRWADKYVFTREPGRFERARTLNLGTALAECDLVLWRDNDMLTAPSFVAQAATELRERGLDHLIPYSSVRYLSEADSRVVMGGERNPADCVPVNVLHSASARAGCSGGQGLVTRDFISTYGGFIEGFRGWGGEDNAWNHKVALLGRSAATTRDDQPVYHLYHSCSGGYRGHTAMADNPHYTANLALLQRVWQIKRKDEFVSAFPPREAAACLATAERHMQFVSDATGAASRVNTSGPPVLPVWTYWEGRCPDWIESCRRTIVEHAPDVTLLTPDSFAQLWDRDRDIDISRLIVAHRSDFIRAFLLARYGGLWVDADCLVMQPLRPVLERVAEHDFVGHRERSGYVSPGFIGARPGSRIAELFYQRVCRTLRSGRSLGWISLGGEPLTDVVNTSGLPWHEYACEQIQPICWSRPEAFFALDESSVHAQTFDRGAICYMLSNTEVSKYQASDGQSSLVDPRSFFSFLLQQALASASRVNEFERIFAVMVAQYRAFGDESLSGPGSCRVQTAELRARLPLLLESLQIRSMLDAPCGDFNWMKEMRLGLDQYVGADILPDIIEQNRRRYGAAERRFVRLDVTRDALPRADCILCRDCLVHFSFADALQTLKNFKASRAGYLLTTTFPDRASNADTTRGEWRTLNLQLPPFDFPQPLRIIAEKCSEANGAYQDKSLALWRIDDLPL